MKNSGEHVAYREYRAQVINGLTRRDLRSYSSEQIHIFNKLRNTIVAFREHLNYHAEKIILNNPEAETHLRKALRIPKRVPLKVTKIMKLSQYLMGMLPNQFLIFRLKTLLLPVGTYEGRALVYRLNARRTFFGEDYSETFDFVIRHLPTDGMFNDRHRMRHVDINWMRIFITLGAKKKIEIDQLYESIQDNRDNAELVLALVDLQIIRSVDELKLLPKGMHQFIYGQKASFDEIQAFRQVVTLFLNAGVAAPWIVRLIELPLWMFNVQKLTENLSQLNLRDNELSILVEKMADRVLRAEPGQWGFLMEVLNVRSAHEMARFETLLWSDNNYNHDFASALLQQGADIDALDACQKLILLQTEGEDKSAPVNNLNTLLGEPYAISFSQLAKAEHYLFASRDLSSYLKVLDSHGFSHADAVLAFQCCYRQLNAEYLDEWLNITAQPVTGQSLVDITDWLTKAAAGGYIDSFQYLQAAGELLTFSHLQQALKLAPLGPVILRYVREERGITGLSTLLNWYYHDAIGIREIRLWYHNDPVSHLLLSDAFERKNFTLLNGNKACVERLLSKHETDNLGQFPFNTNDTQKEEYRRQCHLLRRRMAIRLTPKLKIILEMTEGILLKSLMSHIDESPEKLCNRITELNLQLDGLLNGLGPDNETLTPLEADMIAMVYRTESETIQTRWPKVIGKTTDFAGNLCALTYPMNWQQTELETSVKIDSNGLHALTSALAFSAKFNANFRNDMHEACRHLKAARLGDKAVDVRGLSQHLGVLLAISGCDTSISTEFYGAEGQETIVREGVGAHGHQLAESLVNLFNLELGDALDMRGAEFVQALSDAEATILASRLDRSKDTEKYTPKVLLAQAIERTRSRVIQVFLPWATRQKKRFTKTKISGINSAMRAVVSQSPAAFFAKHSVGLCSAGNTEMWQEARNVHLLIFPSGGKKIDGMALLYFEEISRIDDEKKTLIIRAINPVKAMIASHSISSIVESYFDVAIRIAQDTGCIAVAFPAPSGQGFMSNNKEIEDYIEVKYIKPSESSRYINLNDSLAVNLRHVPQKIMDRFYAYETGNVSADALFVIWCAGDVKGAVLRPEKMLNLL